MLTGIILISWLCFLPGSNGEVWMDTTTIKQRVKAGDTTVLGCSVEKLGRNMVMWFGPGHTLLFNGDYAVTSDRRFSLTHPYSSSWNLVIKNVKTGDEGLYICQVQSSTETLTKEVTVEVQVAPRILPSSSSEDQQVLEGSDVTLVCRATGSPTPKIMWHVVKNSETTQLDTGEQLVLSNISREQTGVYTCTAFNGVVPFAHRQIKVDVEYAPTIIVQTHELSQERGKLAYLECTVVGFPQGRNYWKKDNRILVRDWNYEPQDYQQNSTTTVMNLLIKQVEPPQGFGVYYCVAENKHGTVVGNVTLNEITTTTTTTTPAPTTTITTTTSSTTQSTGSTTRLSTARSPQPSTVSTTSTSTQRPLTPPVQTQSTVQPVITSPYKPVVTTGPGYGIDTDNQDTDSGANVPSPCRAIILLVFTVLFMI